MTQTVLLIALSLSGFLALAGAWSYAAWYFADDGKVLGPAQPDRVTYKEVLQGAFRDVRDLVAPFFVWLHRQGQIAWANSAFIAVGLLDVYAALAPELRELIAHDPRTWGVLALLNLVARFAVPAQQPVRRP